MRKKKEAAKRRNRELYGGIRNISMREQQRINNAVEKIELFSFLNKKTKAAKIKSGELKFSIKLLKKNRKFLTIGQKILLDSIEKEVN